MHSQLDNAELSQVFGRDCTIVQECDVGGRAMGFIEGCEKQRDKRQHADAASVAARSNASKGGFNAETARLRHFTGDEREGAPCDVEWS